MKYFFISTFRKITVGGFVNQQIKEFRPNYEMMPVEYDVSEVILHSSIGEIQFEDYVEIEEWSITVSECKEYVKDDNKSSISKSALSYMFAINCSDLHLL